MKFAFIAKHRSIWPLSSLRCNDCRAKGGMALRSAGCIAFRPSFLVTSVSGPACPV